MAEWAGLEDPYRQSTDGAGRELSTRSSNGYRRLVRSQNEAVAATCGGVDGAGGRCRCRAYKYGIYLENRRPGAVPPEEERFW